MTSESISNVIDNGYCIGCGACKAFDQVGFSIKRDVYESFTANISPGADTEIASEVCPFSNNGLNENQISKALYPNAKHENKYLGRYTSLYVGYVAEGDYRALGSSGGFGKWVLAELLISGLVDFVLQVREGSDTTPTGSLYEYSIVSEPSQVIFGSKSAYYPIEMSGVLQHVRENPGRYAITGVPCFIKAVRLLILQEKVFSERIIFCIGMFCGHLKSAAYAELLGWQMGIEPDQLSAIDFRGKMEGKPANVKGIYASAGDKEEQSRVGPAVTRDLFGGKNKGSHILLKKPPLNLLSTSNKAAQCLRSSKLSRLAIFQSQALECQFSLRIWAC